MVISLKSHKLSVAQNKKFVELYLEKKPGEGVNWIKLWNYYQSWYEEEYGGNISVKKSIIKKYFEDKIFKSKAIPVSKDIGRGWCGWRIKEELLEQ